MIRFRSEIGRDREKQGIFLSLGLVLGIIKVELKGFFLKQTVPVLNQDLDYDQDMFCF